MILIGRGLDFRLEKETDWMKSKKVRAESIQFAVRLSRRGERKITLSGGDNEGVTPVPIPNTEVKPFSADGT